MNSKLELTAMNSKLEPTAMNSKLEPTAMNSKLNCELSPISSTYSTTTFNSSEKTKTLSMRPIKSQTKEENTLAKLQGNKREHLSKAVMIGLANIFGIDMTIRFKPLETPPKSGHNLIVTETSLCSQIPLPSESKQRQENISRTNVIFNTLSSSIQRKLKEIIQQMNGNSEKNVFHLAKGRISVKTEKLNIYTEFEPFNSIGFGYFGSEVMRIIVNHPQRDVVNKKKAFVYLNKVDDEIWKTFCEILSHHDYLTINGLLIRNYCFSMINGNETENNQNVEQSGSIAFPQDVHTRQHQPPQVQQIESQSGNIACPQDVHMRQHQPPQIQQIESQSGSIASPQDLHTRQQQPPQIQQIESQNNQDEIDQQTLQNQTGEIQNTIEMNNQFYQIQENYNDNLNDFNNQNNQQMFVQPYQNGYPQFYVQNQILYQLVQIYDINGNFINYKYIPVDYQIVQQN